MRFHHIRNMVMDIYRSWDVTSRTEVRSWPYHAVE